MREERERTVWAHSSNDDGTRHGLADHLIGTARLASGFAARFGGERAAWWAGLWHDIGKFSCAWQQYLLAREAHRPASKVDHKRPGALVAKDAGLTPVSFAILGHHGGLPSRGDLKGAIEAAGPSAHEAIAAARRAGIVLDAEAREALPAHAIADPLGLETFTRMVFSALVDADFLDTAAHFGSRPSVAPPLSWAALADRFEERTEARLRRRQGSPIGKIRTSVREECVVAAPALQGMFRLHVPTGGGKTIAAMAFAARHAAIHTLERVIVAVPYLSITEQNAAVYRDLLDDPNEDGRPVVLEHHSGVQDPPDQWWRRLAAENWDAPLVVTTTVQLFESLFGRRPSAARKLHRIAGSVVILDEVQALPLHLLVPILDMLRRLVEHYGVTVVLSSATQPELWALEQFRDLPVVDLVHAPDSLASKLRRVRWRWRVDPRPTWDQVAGELSSRAQVLAIVNTVGDAAVLAGLVRDRRASVDHLSTRLCPAHRLHLLSGIRERLAAGEECRVVATQLVEAGVDLDFPEVWRAMGPADSLLQAAGRANREGRLPHGDVVVFDPVDGHLPSGAYRQATDQSRMLFGPQAGDPDDLDLLSRYYRELYSLVHVDEDRHGVQQHRCDLNYPEVADRFRFIPEARASVVVARSVDASRFPWVDPGQLAAALATVDDIESGRPLLGPSRYRDLRPFTVELSVGTLRMFAGLAREIAPYLYVWEAPYDPLLGVAGHLSPEEFVL